MKKLKREYLYQQYAKILENQSTLLLYQMNTSSWNNLNLNDLKRDLLKNFDVEYNINIILVKNSIFRKVLKGTKYSNLSPLFQGQIILISSSRDCLTELCKYMNHMTKKFAFIQILGGIYQNKFLTHEDVKQVGHMILGIDGERYKILSMVEMNQKNMLNSMNKTQYHLIKLLDDRKKQLSLIA